MAGESSYVECALARVTDLLGDAATPRSALHELRLQGFVARVRASIERPDTPDVDLARWAVEAGYHDQAHLGHECRRLLGVTPGEYLAQSRDACSCGHDHAASYVPMLGPGDGRFVQERRPVRI